MEEQALRGRPLEIELRGDGVVVRRARVAVHDREFLDEGGGHVVPLPVDGAARSSLTRTPPSLAPHTPDNASTTRTRRPTPGGRGERPAVRARTARVAAVLA